jgi:hypothetical protein
LLYSKKISLVLASYGAEPAGSEKSMGLYSKAVAQVTAALTEDELEAARQLIHTWNTKGAPPPLQQSRLISFHHMLQTQYLNQEPMQAFSDCGAIHG